MDSAEYERKIAARFATFDQDGNGYIDREDFSAAARAVLAEFGTAARSEHGQAVFAGAEAFWQGMAGIADVDGDQRVTREEFITGAAKRLRDSPERFGEIARPFLHAVLAVAGTSVAGTTRVLRVLGTPPEPAAAIAAGLDPDGDGLISEDDALRAFAAYCGVEAPDA
jgi:hypothetical protein